MNSKNKIILLGDSGVGKTCLINRWMTDSFRLDSMPTIGGSFAEATFEKDGKSHMIHIWDTAGEEKFRSTAPIYARGATGALIVFDITNRTTFLNIESWISCLNFLNDIPVLIVGNKSDLENKREISFSEADNYVHSIGKEYFETSASQGKGINEIFYHIMDLAISYDTKEQDNIGNQIDFSISNKKKCC